MNLQAKYAKNLLEAKTCDNCGASLFCNKRNKKLYSTCLKWNAVGKLSITPQDMLKIVRLAYPNVVSSESFKEFSMEKPEPV